MEDLGGEANLFQYHENTYRKNNLIILSGRGIDVHERRHTSLNALPSQPKPRLLGERSRVVKCVYQNLSRHFKTTLCMQYIQKFSFLYYIVYYFNIIILTWLIVTLDVSTPLKADTLSKVASRMLKKMGKSNHGVAHRTHVANNPLPVVVKGGA